MPPSPNPPHDDFWRRTAGFLPGALVLCLASFASGGLGALVTVRLLHPRDAPSLWRMLRIVLSHAVGG